MSQVKVLLVSEEQQQHVQLDTASINAWPSVQLLDVQRSTHSRLLAALHEVCNLRRSGNLWGFLPEGLPSEYYEMRSDVRRKNHTSYRLVQAADSAGGKGGDMSGGMVLQDLMRLTFGPTAEMPPASARLAVIVTRSTLCSAD